MRRKPASYFPLVAVLLLGLLVPQAIASQQDSYPKEQKPSPARNNPQILVLWDKVVLEQWPATPDLVNFSGELERIEPGQCIRVGVIANGDDASKFLSSSRYAYSFEFRGEQKESHDETFSAIKKLKPEGGDFVTEALGAANIKNPLPTMASIAALQTGWCAPADVQDGTLNIEVNLLNGGKETRLERKSVPVMTFSTARKSVPFSNPENLGPWVQNYHAQPSPAFLLPAIRIVSADNKARAMLNMMQFMTTALKSSPTAANELAAQLPAESEATRIYGTYVLGQAGYPIDDLLKGFNEQSRTALKSGLPDPYDFSPDQLLFQKQDMLWAIFFASGRREPVEAVASMLAWEKDYESFDAVRKAHERDPSSKRDINPSLIRGVTYMSAGWSLGAISRQDPLVTDYLLALQDSPGFPEAAKTELKTLRTNAAFKRGPATK